MSDFNPLVSIIVVIYNSSRFLLETLESIKNQTYEKLELIITDDCSTDNSVEICKEWLNRHKARFVRIELLTSSKNTGVSANCNRGYRAAEGDWIKGIAGDDTLCPQCISDNIAFVEKNPDINVVHSIAFLYQDNINDASFREMRSLKNHIFSNKKISSEDQHRYLLRNYVICPPTTFMKNDIYKKFQFDETIPMIEDVPYYLTLTKNGVKLWYMDIHTVNYRIHSCSISNAKNAGHLYSVYFNKRIIVDKKFIYPNISSIERFFFNLEFLRLKFFTKLGLDRDILLLKWLLKASYIPTYLFYHCNIYLLTRNIQRKCEND